MKEAPYADPLLIRNILIQLICGCKDNKWGDHGDNLGKVVEYKGEKWHFHEDDHWADGSIGPGLTRYEGKSVITERLYE